MRIRLCLLFPVILTVLLAACANGGGDDGTYPTTFSISGDVTTSSGTGDGSNLKLAAYYIGQDVTWNPSSVLVSNVVNLGSTAGTTSFTLNIDPSALNLADADVIELEIWEDDNGNGRLDAGEQSVYAVPDPTCLVWGDLGDTWIWFAIEDVEAFGVKAGWNVETTGNFKPITSSNRNLTGAVLTDDGEDWTL